MLKLFERDVPLVSLTPHLVDFVLAAMTGYFCIHCFLSYVRTHTLYPFACYCALVGVMVLLSLWIRR